MLYATGILTPLMMRLVGVENIGRTDDVFDQVVPTVAIENPVPGPADVTVNLGSIGTVNTSTRDYTVISGSLAGGGPSVTTVTFSESEALAICHERSTICRTGSDQVRSIQVDFRPGGGIVYADVNTGVFWQRVGIVVQLDPSHTQFQVVGVDVSGVVYNPDTLPFGLSDEVGDLIRDFEREGNEALRQLTVDADGRVYRLYDIIIDDQTLTVLMQ
jgi:hypothetical protein